MKKYLKPSLLSKKIKANLFSKYSSLTEINQNGFFLNTYLSFYCSLGCLCVTKDTKIKLANGIDYQIEKIKEGQLVLSFDIENWVFTKNIVKKLVIHKNENKNGYYVINKSLKITGNHHIWVRDKGWIMVEELSIGDLLINHKKEFMPVFSLDWKKGAKTVYNISLVNKPHNYFADGFLIHNMPAYKR